MRTVGQVGSDKRKLYGWRDANGQYCLSSMNDVATVHGVPHRPSKSFPTKQAAEDEATARNSTIEWSS